MTGDQPQPQDGETPLTEDLIEWIEALTGRKFASYQAALLDTMLRLDRLPEPERTHTLRRIFHGR